MKYGSVAQLVEQRPEEPCVAGSSPAGTTKEQLSEETYIFLAKEIQKLVGNKSKYTDWTNRQDVKDELYADVAKLLKKNGYPPKIIDVAYDEIMKQVENYKQYAE